MKRLRLTTNTLMLFLVALLFVACSNDNETVNDSAEIDYSEVSKSSEIDRASDSMDDIAIKVFEAQEDNELSRSSLPPNFNLPPCVIVTVVMQQGYREITIDFGTEGCLVNGNILKGIITLTYDRNPEAQEVMMSKTFTDFYFNNKNIIGGKSILKQLSNDNGNPQFTKTTDITVVWPNGVSASRVGTKVREWVEGHGSGVWSDNVFEVTGNWTTTFVNGNSHSYVVLTPLRREVICYYFVSGSVDVERTNFSGVFDYGDGSCDNLATFTFDDGTIVNITLN